MSPVLPSRLCLALRLACGLLLLRGATTLSTAALLNALIRFVPIQPQPACFDLAGPPNVSDTSAGDLTFGITLSRLRTRDAATPGRPLLCRAGPKPAVVLTPAAAYRLLGWASNETDRKAEEETPSVEKTAGKEEYKTRADEFGSEGLSRTQVIVITTCSAIIGVFFVLAALLRFRSYLQRKEIIQKFLPVEPTAPIKQTRIHGGSKRLRRNSEVPPPTNFRPRRASCACTIDNAGGGPGGSSSFKKRQLRRSASCRTSNDHVPPVVSLPVVDLPTVHSPRQLRRAPLPTAYFPGLLAPASAIACNCRLARLGWPCVHKRFLRRMLNPLYDPSLKGQVEAAKLAEKAEMDRRREVERKKMEEARAEASKTPEEEEEEEEEPKEEESRELRNLREQEETVVELTGLREDSAV